MIHKCTRPARHSRLARLFLATLLCAQVAGIAGTTTGCIARVRPDPSTGKPVRQPTKLEQAAVANLMAAQVNNSISKTVMKAHELGRMPPGAAATVLKANDRFSRVSDEVAAILEQGSDIAKSRGAELRSRLDNLVASVTDMDTLNNLGVKNPDSQEDLQVTVASLRSFVSQIINLLEQAGILTPAGVTQ